MKLHFKHTHHAQNELARIFPDQTGKSAGLIRRAVKIGCSVNLMLLVLKLAAGYFGHSDALVADGFHSLNDVAADLIMLIFVGISYRQADDKYAYGYGKFETFSSFLMSTFLMIVAVVIGVEGVETVISHIHGESLPQPDIWTVITILFAIACKESLYRYYSRVSRKAESKALAANAWHHRSDALASVATLAGVASARFFGPSFRILDPIASILIALFILAAAIRMFRPAFFELMERSLPAEHVAKAKHIIETTPGVLALDRLRTRRCGHRLLFDADIKIAPDSTVEQGAEIAEQIETSLKDGFCPHILLSVSTRS